jgi:hypothetical protein
MRAHALGAINISILGVANTAAYLTVIKAIVSESLLKLVELKVLVRELSGTKSKLIDVLASSMSGAVIRARGALASLSFVTVEAFTLARITVAKTLTGTLSISVASVVSTLGNTNLRVINPRKFEWADSVRAITSVKSHT